MRIAPELAAFLGRPPEATPTPSRAHRMEDDAKPGPKINAERAQKRLYKARDRLARLEARVTAAREAESAAFARLTRVLADLEAAQRSVQDAEAVVRVAVNVRARLVGGWWRK